MIIDDDVTGIAPNWENKFFNEKKQTNKIIWKLKDAMLVGVSNLTKKYYIFYKTYRNFFLRFRPPTQS